MTDAAFTFALTLGTAILIGMLWVSHFTSSRLSKRQRVYGAPRPSDDEPDLFDVTDDESAIRASREIRKRIKQNRLKENAH